VRLAIAVRTSTPALLETLDPTAPCYLAESKRGQQKQAEQQLQHQGYRTIPIFTDFLLVQPGEPQQVMNPVNSTMGIRTLITFGSKMMTMSPEQLKTELSPQILKTKGKEQQLGALVRMMDGGR